MTHPAPSAGPGRSGLLLINLGTPEAPTTASVRRYLREFLSDPRVLDIDPLARALLLNLVILPSRPARSAAAYRQIWSPTRGSPLLYHTMDLTESVRARLGQGWVVEAAMRYGQPSIGSALRRLQGAGASQIYALPLYPQYATSSTGSSLEKLFDEAAGLAVPPPLSVLSSFYDEPGFIQALAALAREALEDSDFEHLLFSFHGLPEHQVTATDFGGARCLKSEGCCDLLTPETRFCYRAQCFATARALAGALALGDGRWSVSFQSRLGRAPWIQPFTDEVIPSLAASGVQRLAVICPSFVADCLETLEEIGIRGRADFLGAGGDSLTLVPCLNSDPRWVDALVERVRRHAQP